MPRQISSAFKEHLRSDVTHLASCWKILRTDGTSQGFTDHDTDILFQGMTYRAQSGFHPTDIVEKGDFSVSNLEVMGILDDIQEEDLLAGRYDGAQIEAFMLSYTDPDSQYMLLKKGWIGEVSLKQGTFQAEIRGLAQKLQTTIGRIFMPSCDAVLGDKRCKVNVESFTFEHSVDVVHDHLSFTSSEMAKKDDIFTGGIVTWVTGRNKDLKMEIHQFKEGKVTLALPMASPITIGDIFKVTAGCNKSHQICTKRFNNLVNFRGFPHLPGQDKILTTSSTRS